MLLLLFYQQTMTSWRKRQWGGGGGGGWSHEKWASTGMFHCRARWAMHPGPVILHLWGHTEVNNWGWWGDKWVIKSQLKNWLTGSGATQFKYIIYKFIFITGGRHLTPSKMQPPPPPPPPTPQFFNFLFHTGIHEQHSHRTCLKKSSSDLCKVHTV